MKKIIYIILVAVVSGIFCACDDEETYAEQRDREYAAIDKFVANPTLGEIKGKRINVISENTFLAQDTVTDTTRNEFVLFDNTGVYMQIVRRGEGSVLKDGESKSILCRFNEYNINGDSLQLSNIVNKYHYLDDKINVTNRSGSFFASFAKTESGTNYQSLMYLAYQSASVPSGWLVPLSYIKLGRQNDNGIAEVRLIVPHDQGHSYASSGVYACYYEISYQEGQ